MKILVLGGTRYFGRHLVHSLMKEGQNIWVLSRGQQEDDFGARVHRLIADRRDRDSLSRALDGLDFDIVIDQICMTAEDAALACDLLAEKTQYYVMTSTMSVYDLGGNLKEEDFNPYLYAPSTPTEAPPSYAEGKRAAEHYFAQHAKFPWAFARFPVVVGEDDYTRRLLLHVQKVKKKEPIYFPNLNAKFSFITSEEAGRALLWLVHGRHLGIYNFASQEALPLKELMAEIEAVTGERMTLSQNEADMSPFGIPQDWFMNVEKAEAAGFTAKPLQTWLRPLLEKLNRVALGSTETAQ